MSLSKEMKAYGRNCAKADQQKASKKVPMNLNFGGSKTSGTIGKQTKSRNSRGT